MSKKLTVLMPIYQCNADWLEESITSILQQTYKNFDFLIIKDGCSKTIDSILNKYKLMDDRIIISDNLTNKGLVYSLNKGLRLSKTPWIARMDADDVASPFRLSRQMEFLEQHPEITILSTFAKYLENEKAAPFKLRPITNKEIRSTIPFINPIVHSTVIFNKNHILSIGGYPNVLYAEDYALWCKLSLDIKCLFHCIPDNLLLYRKGIARPEYKEVQFYNYLSIVQSNLNKDEPSPPINIILQKRKLTEYEITTIIATIIKYVQKFPSKHADKLFLQRFSSRLSITLLNNSHQSFKLIVLKMLFKLWCAIVSIVILIKREIRHN